jgi:hypothetical protein
MMVLEKSAGVVFDSSAVHGGDRRVKRLALIARFVET